MTQLLQNAVTGTVMILAVAALRGTLKDRLLPEARLALWAAVRRLGADRRAEYAAALVTLSTQAEGGAFCHGFGPKRTEERIISIMKYKKATVTGIALTLALVLAVTVGFASNPGADIPDEESTTSSTPAGFQYMVIGDPENDDFLRVRGDGFWYEMPADGWNTYGAYFLYSAYGTDSQIEIYGTGEYGYEGEVELYEGLGYTRIEEVSGLGILTQDDMVVGSFNVCRRAVLTQTEILEFRDGTVLTARYEVYVYGQKGPGQCWVVSLKWIEENLAGKTANEPEIMRAIARSFTITGVAQNADQSGADDDQDGMYICTREDCDVSRPHWHENGEVIHYYNTLPAYIGDQEQDEPHICLLEDCPHQPSVHYHDVGGEVVYVYNEAYTDGDDQGNEMVYCTQEGCTIQGAHFHHDPEAEDHAGDSGEPIACPPETDYQNFEHHKSDHHESESGHHSDGHHGDSHH